MSPVEFWRVLEVLADERGRSMSVLAAEIGMQLPATSKLVDRMTEAALVQRSVDAERADRRVILHISELRLQKVPSRTRARRPRTPQPDRPCIRTRAWPTSELLKDFIRAHQ